MLAKLIKSKKTGKEAHRREGLGYEIMQVRPRKPQHIRHLGLHLR
jgi:hypothetical protein